MSDNARVYHAYRTELAAIEVRNYSEPLDYTEAAIVRSCMRAVEIEILNDLAQERKQ